MDAQITLTLHQAIIRTTDQAPEGRLFRYEHEAIADIAAKARDHLSQYPEYFADMARDAGWSEGFESLDALDDFKIIELANDWDGQTFEASQSKVRVNLPLSAITEALRQAGLAVCVFQPSDVAATIDNVSDAGPWLSDNASALEDHLSTAGNEWISLMLEHEGKARPEDERGDPGSQFTPVAVSDLSAGDLVNLSGLVDDTPHCRDRATREFAVVRHVVRETPLGVRVDFENYPSRYFDQTDTLPRAAT